MSKIHPSIIFITLFFLFTGCVKEVGQTLSIDDPLKSEAAMNVSAWLESQLLATNIADKKSKIKILIQNLDFSKLYFEDLFEGERFLVVPIKKTFVSENNTNKNPINSLVLILDRTDAIRKGNIVQYVSEKLNTSSIPINSFHNIFNFKKIAEDGSFTFLSITDKLMYQYNYKDGKLSSHALLQKGSKPTGKNNFSSISEKSLQCIDWYLVTYYTDGTQTWQYLYTDCREGPETNNCKTIKLSGWNYRIDCSGAGDSGNDDWEENLPVRQVEWEVGSNDKLDVSSVEEFSGMKTRISQRARFTGVRHISSAVHPSAYYTWTETVHNSDFVAWGANCFVEGWVRWSLGEFHVKGGKGFLVTEVFP